MKVLRNIKNFGGGGTLGLVRGQEARKARWQASIGERSSLNTKFFSCISKFISVLSPRERARERVDLGSPEVKRSGRQADIGGQSLCKDEFSSCSSMLPKRTYRPNVLTSYRLKKKVAFTLAEVLITLGIIGIVAAMTIPTLVSQYRAQVLQAQFKKRYSEVSQALVQLKKNDEYLNVTNGPQLQDFLVRQFKEAKAPARDIYISTPERQKELLGFELPVYKTFDKSSEYYNAALDDGFIFINNEYFVFINSDYYSLNNASIIIDINGLKGPNIAGYDLFFFSLDENFILRSTDDNVFLCNKTSSAGGQSGRSCSHYAMTDKDYFKNLGW